MSGYKLAPRANRDLAAIEDYIAADSPAAARRTIIALRSKCRMLSRTPRIGKRRDELAPDLRSFPMKNYTIFYRLAEKGIEIIRILHGARDIERIFSEEE